MQMTQTFASKALVAVVATAMIFSAFVAPAKAATAEELQKMINDLMAQMAALQGGSTTGSTSAAGVCPFTWTRDLKTGATGADVMSLQKFLNANADTRVAATGAGSTGMETTYFGPATAAAVSKFQVMHRADILTPAGLTNPTGFFGPSTRAKANALCVTSTGTTTEEEGEDEEGSAELSGEATLDDVSLDAADEDEIEEGDVDAPVAEATFTFTDGDASISRIDVSFAKSGSDMWDVLDTVSLWVDGDMVAEASASDEDDYLDEDDGSIRFSGLDIVGMEDEDLDITIGVTLQDNLDSGDRGTFTVGLDSVRYFDADGVAETDSATGDLGSDVSFEIVEAGADDELIVKTSSNDPDQTTLRLKDDARSDWEHVFSFDLDTDDSTNDITVDEVVVTVEVSSSTYAAIVDDAELDIDGTIVDKVTVTGTSTQTATLTFDSSDDDIVIEAGDRVEAKLMLKFKSLALGNEGITVRGSVTGGNADAIDAEGADTLTTTQLQGSATGDYHYLRTTGVSVDAFATDVKVTTTDTADNSYGEFVLTFDVTAVGDDEVYVPLTAATMDAAGSSTRGAVFKVTDANGNLVASSSADQLTASLVLEEGGDDSTSGYVRLEGDETATLKLTVVFNPGTAAGQYIVVLDGVGFAATAAPATQQTRLSPATDYDTAPTQIQS